MMQFKPYLYLMRLHRPIPILLLLWPTYWALWVAANGFPPIKILIIFTLGVFLMRSAGCVFNDIADQRFDRHVTRTKIRPLAQGDLNTKQALVLGVILIMLAFVLVLLLNPFSIVLSFIALLLACLYPFAKRFTHWPQAILGLAFNFGILMAFAAISNHLPLIAWWLYGISILWTLAYDTFYAMADREDDLRINIKSTAILFAQHTYKIIFILQALMLVNLVLFGLYNHYSLLFYLIILCCVPLFIYELWIARQASIVAFIKAFSHNHWIGLIIFLGFITQF